MYFSVPGLYSTHKNIRASSYSKVKKCIPFLFLLDSYINSVFPLNFILEQLIFYARKPIIGFFLILVCNKISMHIAI